MVEYNLDIEKKPRGEDFSKTGKLWKNVYTIPVRCLCRLTRLQTYNKRARALTNEEAAKREASPAPAGRRVGCVQHFFSNSALILCSMKITFCFHCNY